jgi:hypothetical protein
MRSTGAFPTLHSIPPGGAIQAVGPPIFASISIIYLFAAAIE